MEMCKQVTWFCVIKMLYPIHNSQHLKIIAHYLKQQIAYVLCSSRKYFRIVISHKYENKFSFYLRKYHFCKVFADGFRSVASFNKS